MTAPDEIVVSEEMLRAGVALWRWGGGPLKRGYVEEIYRAMRALEPSPPAAGDGKDAERLDWLQSKSDGGPWWLNDGDCTFALRGEKLGEGPLTTVREAIDSRMDHERRSRKGK